MNKNIFSGNLGKDIEVRQVGENKVCNNSIAVNKFSKGEKKTVWVPLTFWNKTAELLEQYCRKGSKILVVCEFDIQEYTNKEGVKVQSPRFTVSDLEFLDPRDKPENSGQTPPEQNQQSGNSNPFPLPPQYDFIEDDIPF